MKINYSKLNNDELYTLSKRIHEVLSPAPVTELGIEVYYNTYLAEHEKYKTAMLKLKEVLKIISDKDRRRDKDGINLRRHVKNYTNHPNEKIASKAQELLDELDRHGVRFYRKKYKEQTAILEYIFNAIDTHFANFIKRIHADEWYQFLKESQQDFENTRKRLTEKDAQTLEEESPSKIRPDLIDAMRDLLTFMPLLHRQNKNPELEEIIKKIEAELKRF